MADRVCVGAVAGAFGVRGEVKLKSFCARPESMGDYGTLASEDGSRSFEVEITRAVKNGFAAKLTGVRTREEADALRGTRLYAPREALPTLPDDEFYHADLIGLPVLDGGGVTLGKVRAVIETGAHDILELHAAGGEGAILLPFTKESVPTVDLAAGRIVADPPEGLLPVKRA